MSCTATTTTTVRTSTTTTTTNTNTPQLLLLSDPRGLPASETGGGLHLRGQDGGAAGGSPEDPSPEDVAGGGRSSLRGLQQQGAGPPHGTEKTAGRHRHHRHRYCPWKHTHHLDQY